MSLPSSQIMLGALHFDVAAGLMITNCGA